MRERIRSHLQPKAVLTGVATADEESFVEREFGIDPDDPAARHIMRALIQLKVRYGIDVREHRELLPKVIATAQREHAALAYRDDEEQPVVEPVVYYVRVGHLIKVGTTVNLHSRLRAYPPGATVLATEPGGYDVERERHQEFRDALAERKEWFRPTVELIEHINSLREQPLTAVDLAA